MTYTDDGFGARGAARVVSTRSFLRAARGANLTDEDLQALEAFLAAAPHAGSVIRGTNGARKVRFAPPSYRTAKSGALRVITVHIAAPGDTVYLLSAYAKSDQANLTPEQAKAVAKMVRHLKDAARKGRR